LTADGTGTLAVNNAISAGSVSDGEVSTLRGGTVTTTGGQTYNDAVILASDTTLIGSWDTFKATVDGDYNFTVTANGTSSGDTVTFDAAVGNSVPLNNLTITSALKFDLGHNELGDNIISWNAPYALHGNGTLVINAGSHAAGAAQVIYQTANSPVEFKHATFNSQDPQGNVDAINFLAYNNIDQVVADSAGKTLLPFGTKVDSTTGEVELDPKTGQVIPTGLNTGNGSVFDNGVTYTRDGFVGLDDISRAFSSTVGAIQAEPGKRKKSAKTEPSGVPINPPPGYILRSSGMSDE
jgi:hypothetical protein